MSRVVWERGWQVLMLTLELGCRSSKKVDAIQRSLQAIRAATRTAATAEIVRRQRIGGRYGIRDVRVRRRNVR